MTSFHKTGLRIFATVWLVYAVTNNFDLSWMNDNALALSQAILAKGTIVVDGFVSETDKDVAFRNGKFYSGVPPGISFVSLPFTAVLQPLWNASPVKKYFDNPDSMIAEIPLVELHTYFLNMVLGALLAVIIFKAVRLLGLKEREGVFVAIAYSFGTIMFLYASDYFQRPLAAFCLFTSFYLMMKVRHGSSKMSLLWAAGSLWGMAWWFDYSAFVPMGALGLYLLAFHRGRGVFYFGGGALPAIALFFLYNWAAFGSPLGTPHFNRASPFPRDFFAYLALMEPRKIWVLLLSSYRGYFFYMPILLLGAVGVARWIRRGPYRLEGATIATMFFLELILNVATPLWHGGRSFGPRYLMTTVPFVALALGGGIKGARKPFLMALLTVSVCINWMGALFTRDNSMDPMWHYVGSFMHYGPAPYPVRLVVWKAFVERNVVSPPWDAAVYWAAGIALTSMLAFVLWLIWRKWAAGDEVAGPVSN